MWWFFGINSEFFGPNKKGDDSDRFDHVSPPVMAEDDEMCNLQMVEA
jgi:hypothetical protein